MNLKLEKITETEVTSSEGTKLQYKYVFEDEDIKLVITTPFSKTWIQGQRYDISIDTQQTTLETEAKE